LFLKQSQKYFIFTPAKKHIVLSAHRALCGEKNVKSIPFNFFTEGIILSPLRQQKNISLRS